MSATNIETTLQYFFFNVFQWKWIKEYVGENMIFQTRQVKCESEDVASVMKDIRIATLRYV